MKKHRELAKHQGCALEKLDKWWTSSKAEDAHGFVAMPTGSGKTYTAVQFVVERLLSRQSGDRVVWVAHNEFLLDQAEAEFRRQLVDAKLLKTCPITRVQGNGAGADGRVVFATIQTLARENNAVAAIKRKGDVELVVFDEFHHLAADTWRRVPKRFQRGDARTLGLSATPFRTSQYKTEQLRKILPKRIYSVGYTELVKDKFLAEPILRRVKVGARQGVTLSEREMAHLRQFRQLNNSALKKIADQQGRSQLIVETYKQDRTKYGSTLVFCCSVDHAESMAKLFVRKGIPTECICGSAKDPENREKVEAFRNGEFPVATSVLLLTEGVDFPNCQTVFLARPSESPILISQMIGRAMRGPKAGGTKICHIVDFVDILNGKFELAASHFAFVRDRDEKIRELVRRPPKPEDEGVSFALLLRIREYLNDLLYERRGVVDLKRVLVEEVSGWFEHWDGEMRRVLLVPKKHATEIHGALLEAEDRVKSERKELQEMVAPEIARDVYDSHNMFDKGVSEEDFVTMTAAVARDRKAASFHPLSGKHAYSKNKKKASAGRKALQVLKREATSAGLLEDTADSMKMLESTLTV